MDIPPTLLIIVGFIIVVLGIGAGMLLSSLNEEVEPEEGVDQAPPGGRKGRYTPVARLWRERGTGSLIVEMDNKSFINPEPLTEIQRERLEHTARDLRAWLGMGLAGAGEAMPPEAVAAPAPIAPPEAVAAAAAAAASAAAVSAATASAAAAFAAPAVAPVTPPVRPPVKVVPPARGKEEVAAPVPLPLVAKSIVMQIEDVLQDMIASTPMAHRGIHLIEDPIRGVIVKVGAEQYEGIDSVADPEVKATIRAAVAEWEKSQ